MKTLPDKLSDGILLALEDLEQAEKDPRYRVEMGTWHLPLADVCEVCLAGSVMAFSLGASPAVSLEPSDYPGLARKLDALDQVHRGNVSSAVFEWDYDEYRRNVEAVDKLNRRATDYHTDPSQFKRDMRRIAQELAEIGL